MMSITAFRASAIVLATLIAATLVALTAVPADASKYVAIKGAPAPGPREYDEVFVDKFGPRRARTVLVLIPGTGGGAGSLAPIARDLSRRIPKLQVWAFDRRSQHLEDTSGFESGDADAAAYYLGFKYEQPGDVPFVSDWGLATEMNDLHRVIAKASKRGRKVILGGHSRGGSSVVAYAAWDFGEDGPGFRDIEGMVLIDGGLGTFGSSRLSLEEAQAGLAEIEAGDYFSDPLGAGIPEIGPIFSEVAALYAKRRPHDPSVMQSNPLVVAAGLAPPFAVTNEGFLGYLFDSTYSPLGKSLQIRAGDFGAGDPRPWVDGENTPIEQFARAFSREPGNATEWYYPNRMILDTGAANALKRTEAADYLGLRLFHARRIDVPLYAIQTELTGGGVIAGAKRVIERSRIERSKLIDASATMSHLDPTLAPAASNRFTKTVTPFLKRITRKRR